MDGCDEKKRRNTELYLLSMLAHEYNIIIDHVVGSPSNGKYFVDGLNEIDKNYPSMLMGKLKSLV